MKLKFRNFLGVDKQCGTVLQPGGQNPDFNSNNLTNIPILIDKVEPISQF
jgi:hypothetical protein